MYDTCIQSYSGNDEDAWSKNQELFSCIANVFTCSEGKSQSPGVASENSEPMDKSLLSSASQSTQHFFAAFNLAELTAGNQSEQKYALFFFSIFIKQWQIVS